MGNLRGPYSDRFPSVGHRLVSFRHVLVADLLEKHQGSFRKEDLKSGSLGRGVEEDHLAGGPGELR